MAINFDHTNSASITLKGPDNAQQNDNFTFVFPNVISETAPSLLISGEAPISAISGLVSALSAKVEKNTTGSAALLNYGTSCGNVVQLNEYGKIPDSLISSVAIRDVFSVADFCELTSNNFASIGDIGIVSNENKNYVLCSSGVGAYATQSNWKEVIFPVQVVTSVNSCVGDVVLDGSNVYGAVGSCYAACSIDSALSDLVSTKANLSSLIDYATTGYVTGCLNNYFLSCNLSSCLSAYVSDSDLSLILTDYSTTTQISSCLTDNYVPKIETGSAASLDVGISAGNVVQLNGDGKIPNEVIPHLAITDVFVVNTSGDLTSLSDAQKGDVAIATGSRLNYILKETDYSAADHWVQFSASVGNITGVNNVAPIDGIVTLTSSNIYVVDSTTIYDETLITNAISGLDSRVQNIEDNYLTETEASDLLTSYVTTGSATGIFNTKSDNGHGHTMSDVTGLVDCLASISAFNIGDGSYSAVLQGSVNPHYNVACGNYSVALGKAAKTVQDYEVAQGAGLLSNPGDAQVSKLIAKATTNNDSFTPIAEICMQNYSNILFSSYVVGRGPSKYAAFKINGSANREGGVASTMIIGEVAKDIYVNTDSAYFADAVENTTDGKIEIKVSGDSLDSMQWVTSTTVTKIIWD